MLTTTTFTEEFAIKLNLQMKEVREICKLHSLDPLATWESREHLREILDITEVNYDKRLSRFDHVLYGKFRSNVADHPGMIGKDLVSEPYFPFDEIEYLLKKLKLVEETEEILKRKAEITPFSWHWPGECFRVTYFAG